MRKMDVPKIRSKDEFLQVFDIDLINGFGRTLKSRPIKKDVLRFLQCFDGWYPEAVVRNIFAKFECIAANNRVISSRMLEMNKSGILIREKGKDDKQYFYRFNRKHPQLKRKKVNLIVKDKQMSKRMSQRIRERESKKFNLIKFGTFLSSQQFILYKIYPRFTCIPVTIRLLKKSQYHYESSSFYPLCCILPSPPTSYDHLQEMIRKVRLSLHPDKCGTSVPDDIRYRTFETSVKFVETFKYNFTVMWNEYEKLCFWCLSTTSGLERKKTFRKLADLQQQSLCMI